MTAVLRGIPERSGRWSPWGDGADPYPGAVAPPDTPEPARLRVAVWDGAGTRRLAGARTVAVAGGIHAPPGDIVDAVRRQLGLAVTVLRAEGADGVEVVCGRDASARGLSARGLGPWIAATLPPVPRQAWHRPGWLAATLAQVDVALPALALRRTGRPRPMRHTSVTALLRIPTDGGPVWLKAVPPLFAHEPGVVRGLAALAPGRVPTVLAEGDGWWLAAAFPKARADGGAPPEHRPGPGHDIQCHDIQCDALVTLARMQIAAAASAPRGCPDRPLTAVAGELAALAARSRHLGDADRAALATTLAPFSIIAAEAMALGFPTTIVHGDLSPDNLRRTGDGWFVYDWTDACLSHPLVDLACPLAHEADPAVAGRRAEAYAQAWAGTVGPAAIGHGLRLAPVVGAAFQLANYGRILTIIDPEASDRAGGVALAGHLRYWLRRLAAGIAELRARP